METLAVRSWDEFERLANEMDGWAFRGQKSAQWPLWSAISRHLQRFVPEQESWAAREQRAIRVFQRKAHNYLTDPLALDNTLRCLAMMQHHGAPTRLLDFTKSPYVAAFFALAEAELGQVAIYAVNTPMLWHARPRSFPDLSRDIIDPRERSHFERYFLSNEYPLVWTGEPGKLDRRLLAQSGTFVVPGRLDKPVDELLVDQYGNGESVLIKMLLPAELRAEAMQNLYRMNITYATLFSDLEGLARSSAFELEIMWKGVISYPKQRL